MKKEKHYAEKLEAVIKILHFLKTYTLFIIDEIDSVMDLTKSLNFNTHHIEKHDDKRIARIIKKFYEAKDLWIKAKDGHVDEKKFNSGTEFELAKACLEKKINYNYGFSSTQKEPFVIPYSGSNNPSDNSTFADFWFSLGLTVKFYLEEKFTDFPKWIDERQREQLRQMLLPRK